MSKYKYSLLLWALIAGIFVVWPSGVIGYDQCCDSSCTCCPTECETTCGNCFDWPPESGCDLNPNAPGCGGGDESGGGLCNGGACYKTCQQLMASYGDARGTGSGSFFRAQSDRNTPWDSPNASFGDDVPAYHAVWNGGPVPAQGLSLNSPFAFNYVNQFSIGNWDSSPVTEDNSHSVPQILTDAAQYRSYSHITIPDGLYLFSIRANRSVGKGYPNWFSQFLWGWYCQVNPDGYQHRYCAEEGGKENITECSGRGEDRSCEECSERCVNMAYRPPDTDCLGGCGRDIRGMVIAWLAVENPNDGDSGESPLQPAACPYLTTSATYLEDCFKYYSDQNKWLKLAEFNHNFVVPGDSPEETSDIMIVGSGVKKFIRGSYPMQFSGSWGGFWTIWNPQLWWTRINEDYSTEVWSPRRYVPGQTVAGGLGNEVTQLSACKPAFALATCSLTFNNAPAQIEVGVPAVFSVSASTIPPNALPSSFSTSITGPGSLTVSPSSGVGWGSNPKGFTIGGAEMSDIGDYNFTVNGITSAGQNCTKSQAFSVVHTADPWFQVKDADVVAGGSLVSRLPAGEYFDLPGPGGFPGVPLYADFTNLAVETVSETFGWLAQSDYSAPAFGFDHFYKLVQENVPAANLNTYSGNFDGGAFDGYEWYYADSGADVDSQALADQKIVLLVKGSVNIKENDLTRERDLTLTKGQGFLMIVASGGIDIKPEVEKLEGVFVAQTVNTGEGDQPLAVRGTVVGLVAVNLGRDLGAGNAAPAEVFEYAPDILLRIPYIFNSRLMRWKEVAP